MFEHCKLLSRTIRGDVGYAEMNKKSLRSVRDIDKNQSARQTVEEEKWKWTGPEHCFDMEPVFSLKTVTITESNLVGQRFERDTDTQFKR